MPTLDNDKLIEQAETRTEQANLRTDQANTRTDEANARTEQADLRTEKAEAQAEALRDSELSYRRLFESARDGILILDADTGHIMDVNPFLVELLGYSHDEMVGKTVGEMSPFRDILSNQAMLERLQRDGYIRYEDLPLETRDGRRVSVEFVSNVYQAGDNKVIQCNIRDISERKVIEMGMSRLAAIVESSDDAILGTDLDGIITNWNKGAETIFGYTAAELVGTSNMRLIPADRQEELNQILGKIKRGEHAGHFETLRQTKDGRLVNVSVTASPIKDATGKVVGVSKILCDITEHKQAEEALRDNQARLDLALRSSDMGVWCCDIIGNKRYLDDQVCHLLGINPATFTGSAEEFFGEVHPDDRETIKAALTRTIEQDVLYKPEYRTVWPDGSVHYISARGRLVRDDKGQPLRINGIIWDITERKRAEESHARLAMAVEQSAETIVITDLDAQILYANPAFEKTTGYTRAEALGQNPRILKSGKHDAEFYRRMWDVLTRGEVWHGHFVNQRKDGTLYEEEATLSPVRDTAGKVVNYVAVKRDVTHEMQLETQFRQSQKMEAIGTLAGGVAHDFNNILAIIQMQADLLKSDGDLAPAQLELANDISIAVQRAAALTRQLLLFSRKEMLQPRNLDLNHSVNEMTKMLKRTLGENIAVQLNLAAQPMLLQADAGMMDQVLMNLAVNARDAMPEGGQLVIETAGVEFDEFAATQTAQARSGSFVRLSVCDNGCGIPPENLARIFDPFFTTKGVGKGTGLGLATVFGIAQQHQGWVNVYSEVGHGTTFKVYLPRRAESHDTKIIKKVPTTAPTGHETILLAEDEPALRTILEKSLTRLGYRVLAASTGFKALEVWKAHPAEIHLLLTDLMMPDGMSGKDLAQRLLSENPKLKVIYMSGYSPDIVAQDFPLQEGVNFLTKPFQVQQIAQTIRQRLDAPAAGT